MATSPRVSLVITTFNRDAYLGAAIASVLAQTFTDFELLIWDDGSTDRTLEIAQSYAAQDDRVRVIAAPHQGRSQALQAAIAATQAPYLGWVDDDDCLTAEALAKTVAVLQQQADVGVVYTDYLEMDAAGTIRRYGYRGLMPYSKERLLLDFMTYQFRLVRREVFEQVGGIDVSLRSVEDYDLCLRLSEVTEFYHLQEPLYLCRLHSQNGSEAKRVKRLCGSQIVINRALQRRGLSDRYQLELRWPAGYFELRPRSPQPHWPRVGPAAALVPLIPLLGAIATTPVLAQSITPAADGTGTVVQPVGPRYDIGGGTLSSDGQNLFQSFQRFGLNQGEIANFLANPTIRNILGRVTGGDASYINGLIQVSGGNPNLFLINPAGIVFGPNASLNVPAAFTATTATGINFGTGLLDALGPTNYAPLTGNPTGFTFGLTQPGAIANFGNLTVAPGQSLTLLGGTVFSPGNLAAPGGTLTVASVPGQSTVRLTAPGSLLSLEIQPFAPTNAIPLTPLALPALLTGGNLPVPTNVAINPDGSVQLGGTELVTRPGDVLVQGVSAETATVAAVNNLVLPASNLQTTGNLTLVAGQTLLARDSVTTPLVVWAGGDLRLQGNQAIDILALNHLPTQPFQSGGDLTLASDGPISGDSHFASGGNLSFLTLAGQPGTFLSFYDPIISATGDVTFGNYTGASLKVETTGSIVGGNIEVQFPDFALTGTDPDIPLLASRRTVILRAGTIPFNLANTPQATGGTTFNATVTPSPNASITVGNVTTGDVAFPSPEAVGPVILTAPGTITTGTITTTAIGGGYGSPVSAGDVTITAGGNVTTGDILANYAGAATGGAQGGTVTITTGGSLVSQSIVTSAITTTAVGVPAAVFRGGNVILTANGIPGNSNIQFAAIDASGQEALANADGFGGTVAIAANGTIRGTLAGDTILTQGSTAGGTVTIQHDGGVINVPFTVGGVTGNGLTGRINTGTAVLNSGSFPVLPNGGDAAGTPAGITIRSVNTAPSLTATANFAGGAVNVAVTISFADLAATVSDANNDGTVLRIAAIAPGATVTVNGNPAVPGTILSPGDTITYTPPLDATGQLDAFTLQADDAVAGSNLVPVRFTITGPPPADIPACTLEPCGTPTPTNFPGGPPTTVEPVSLGTVYPSEENFTQAFQAHLGLTEQQPLQSTDDGKIVAQQIEEATGEKPAFVYVSFVPPNVPPAILSKTKELPATKSLAGAATDELEVLVVSAQGTPFRQRLSGVTRQQVQAMAQRLRLEVSDPRKTRSTSYLPYAQQMYDWIMRPIAAELEKREITNLVFLMDEGLRSLPIAALHDGQQFLIETYSVGLMPSLSLTDTRYRDVRTQQVLALGIADSMGGLPPLPAVPVEVNAIATEFWQGQSLLNERATLANLNSVRQQTPYGILHLATHADFRPGQLQNSFIQFWGDRLQLDGVRQLSWNNPQVELLVLSACVTALGDREAELGFAGFAAKSGVKSVLASLWYVSDATTAGLMASFYHALYQPKTIKAEGLRQAQLALLRGELVLKDNTLTSPALAMPLILPPGAGVSDQEFRHPYYWASFTMVGNPW